MINTTGQNKKYEITGHGSIEIEVAKTTRNYYPANLHTTDFFSLEILSQSQDLAENEPFILFEWQLVSFIAVFNQNDTDKEYSLWVNDKKITSSKDVNAVKLLNAGFTFKNQVGLTSFKILSPSGEDIFKLQTEVFPQKMDYKSDYKAIIEDISKIVHNLTYAILRDTYQKAKPKVVGHTTEIEWWNILDTLYQALMKSFDIIRKNPKHNIVAEQKIESIDRIKRHSSKNRVWLQRNTKYISSNPANGIELIKDKYVSHALSLKKKIIYDNYENRFVKFAANQTIYRLISFRKELERTHLIEETTIASKVDQYIGRLSGFLMQSPFNEVGEFEKQNHFSTTLTKAAGYKDFLQIHLLLQKGLDILNDDIFKIESKDISQLYEYWCFLKLTEIIMRLSNFEIRYQDLIKLDTGKFKVDLKVGNQSEIQFKNTANEEITIFFNKEFNRGGKKTFTYSQKPDHSIKFTKEGYDKPFWFIFDAKYRFNENEDNYDVPDDAIGQLHRYRDAILHTEFNAADTSYKTTIKNLGGIILYPYPEKEEQYLSSKYFKSIDEVNIGALPMLPSKTSLVENYIRKLFLEKTPEDHFREFIGMDYSEYVIKREEFDKTITIGVVKSKNQKERLSFLEEHNLHYFPLVKDDQSRIYRSEYLLLAKSRTKEAILKKVKRWEIISSKELSKIVTNWRLNHQKYILFHLEEQQENIEISPEIIPINFRYTSMRGLKLFQKEANNKTLYLTTESAYRLYYYLVRKNIDFNIVWSKDQDDEYTGIVFNLKNDLNIFSSEKLGHLNFIINDELNSLSQLMAKI